MLTSNVIDHRSFDTRIVISKVVNNGESMNWRHDWFKCINRSYSEVVKNVSVNKNNQVDDYPWFSRGAHKDVVNTTKVTNRDKCHSKVRCPYQNHRLKHDPKGQVHSLTRTLVSNQDVPVFNEATAKAKPKVRDIFPAHCHDFPQKIPDSHHLWVSQNNVFSPLVCHNSFAPLAAPILDHGEKVVIQELQGGTVDAEGKAGKKYCNQSKGRSNTVIQGTGQNGTVGGASSVAGPSKALNTRVDDRQFLATNTTVDKYDLALRFKSKHKNKIEQSANSEILKLWDGQTVGKFGYIPLTEQVVVSDQQISPVNPDLLQVHGKVKQTGTYNFLGAQIPIPSQLKVKAWEANLKGYWDKQLVPLIKYGFPLSFNHNIDLISTEVNHSSARQFPLEVEGYLEEEKSFNAILGPFSEPPIPGLHISPFLTREKNGGTSRRVIVDLSFPPGSSVNAGVDPNSYLGSEFLLTLPSIDYITGQVLKLGKGSLIYKIDISRAFRHIKIDPLDYNLLGLSFKSYFIDTCLPFGFRHGSAMFQRLSDSIRYMMLCRGHHVTNYIDDIIGQATRSQAESSFNTLYNLLGELGLDISKKKLVPPSTQALCLGVMINTENFTISAPDEKLAEIKEVCSQWQLRDHCSKRDLQSLLGRLLYVTKCVKASRPFLNRMLELLRQADRQEKIVLSEDFHRDLNWFSRFLTKFNGVAFFSHDPVHFHIELDASLQGLGAVCGNEVYAVPVELGYKGYQIVHLEMLNILVAMRVWAHIWHEKRVVIHCDNQAVVAVINSGKTRDPVLAAITRNIAMLTATHDINLKLVHILGKHNIIADALSRIGLHSNYQVQLHHLIPHHTWLEVPIELLEIDWSI